MEVAPKNDTVFPFEETAVDRMGPWKTMIAGVGIVEFNALTMIDSASVLTELV